MGLTGKKEEYTIEEKALGLDAIHNTDVMIDDFLSKKKRPGKQNSLSNVKKVQTRSVVDRNEKRILKVSTFGFKNGELQHNMPCPVCLENKAVFTSDGFRNFFSPCRKCEEDGYVTKNTNLEEVRAEKKGWFS